MPHGSANCSKKVLLINPPLSLNYWDNNRVPHICFPTGLLSISAVLAQRGYEARVVDGLVDRDFKKAIMRDIDDVLFAGISCMTVQISPALEIAQLIREANPQIPLFWGGCHPTLFPAEMASDPLVDFACIGEGEYTAADLADALSGLRPVSSVEGIACREGGKVIVTAPRKPLTLDDLPLIDYEAVDLSKYMLRDLGSSSFGIGATTVFVLHTGRGCPYRCAFCMNAHHTKYSQKKAEILLREIDHIMGKYSPHVIYFQDDNFFAAKDRTLGFFKGVQERGYGFKWFCITRANYFRDGYLDANFWEAYGGNCIGLGMGVESGVETVRNHLLNKNLTNEEVENAIQTCDRFKLPVHCSFMTALPGETMTERVETVRYIMKLKKMCPSMQSSIQYYQPFPGAPLYERAVAAGFSPPRTLREWADTVNTKEWYGWYVPIERLPWVENKPMIKYLMWMIPFYSSIPSRIGARIRLLFSLGRILARLSLSFRVKAGFWHAFFELTLIEAARKLRTVARAMLRPLRGCRGDGRGE